MYCIKCGVKLADTEKRCPLCSTIVCHPDFESISDRPLYPSNKPPTNNSGSNALNVVMIILFLIFINKKVMHKNPSKYYRGQM